MKKWFLNIFFACTLLLTAIAIASEGSSENENVKPCAPNGCIDPSSPSNVDPD